jgi:hypothetical protein
VVRETVESTASVCAPERGSQRAIPDVVRRPLVASQRGGRAIIREHMIEEELSGAVVVYVWGVESRPWPSRNPDEVRRRYGERAEVLIARIELIFAVVDAAPVDWNSDLAAASMRVQRLVRRSFPELDAAAVHAVGAQFAYSWR